MVGLVRLILTIFFKQKICMSKIIIAEKILGEKYVEVALRHAETLITQKKLNLTKIQTDINGAQSPDAFVVVFNKHFGDDLKLIHSLM